MLTPPVLLALLLPWVAAGMDEDPAPVDFARDVLPILSDRCYACHGPDGAGRRAGLRLDLKEHAFADRDGFPALVPGDLEASELAARIRSEFPEDTQHRKSPRKRLRTTLSILPKAYIYRFPRGTLDSGATF